MPTSRTHISNKNLVIHEAKYHFEFGLCNQSEYKSREQKPSKLQTSNSGESNLKNSFEIEWKMQPCKNYWRSGNSQITYGQLTTNF